MDTSTTPGGNEPASAPLTFEQAFAAETSPVSTPDSEGASATTAVESSSEAVTPQPGPETGREPFIPRSRFDEVNTKAKALQEWREKHAWAESYDPSAVQQMSGLYARAVADPRAFALSMLDQLASDPTHGPAIRSELARRLGTRTRDTGPVEDGTEMPQPDVSVMGPNGEEIARTYSDKQLAKRDAFLRQQMLSEVESRYAPQFKTLETIKAQAEQQQAQAHAQSFAASFSSELATLPLFAEHKTAIAEALKDAHLDSDHPSEVRAATYKAYWAIVGPKLTQPADASAVLADLQRKGAAATSINPGRAASATSTKPKSFTDPTLVWS